jgi:hypothetical protein
MVEHGLLTEEPYEGTMEGSHLFEGLYFGFSWSGMAPHNKITDKGRALVAQNAMVEW